MSCDAVSSDVHLLMTFIGQATEQEVKGFWAFMIGPNLGIEIWDPLYIWLQCLLKIQPLSERYARWRQTKKHACANLAARAGGEGDFGCLPRIVMGPTSFIKQHLVNSLRMFDGRRDAKSRAIRAKPRRAGGVIE